MRGWLVDRIKLDDPITSKLDPDGGNPVVGRSKVISAGSAGFPGGAELQAPFIVVRAMPTQPALAGLGAVKIDIMPYLVWVHDQQGSFEDVIGSVLFRLRTVLHVDLPIRMQSGEVLMESRWEGDSNDLFDDTFSTATRYSQWRLTAKRA